MTFFFQNSSEPYEGGRGRQPEPSDMPDWRTANGDCYDADISLADRAAHALRRDAQVRGRYLEILVQNQVVILTGELDSAGAREAARRRAWSVPGVYDVCNLLGVTGEDDPGPSDPRGGAGDHRSP